MLHALGDHLGSFLMGWCCCILGGGMVISLGWHYKYVLELGLEICWSYLTYFLIFSYEYWAWDISVQLRLRYLVDCFNTKNGHKSKGMNFGTEYDGLWLMWKHCIILSVRRHRTQGVYIYVYCNIYLLLRLFLCNILTENSWLQVTIYTQTHALA